MKKFLSFILAAALALTLCACGTTTQQSYSGPVVDFTDSAGRTVSVPEDIERIAVTGPLAQIFVFSLAPDKMVALASDWSADAAQYLDTAYYQLPVLGQLYGGSSDLNLEELLKVDPQVIIDVGETKSDITEDMDKLQQQTGIPCVHITADIDTMAEAYLLLGELLNMESEAELLAKYCEQVYATMRDIMEQVGENKAQVLYCLGDFGTNVICQGSYHAGVLDLLTDNLAVVESPSSKGTGNEVNMEQLYIWDPDVIFFGPDSYYSYAAEDPDWQVLSAIQSDSYYEVPYAIYCWMGFPPSVQRYLGMLWMADILYPEYVTYDLYEQVAAFYELFFHCILTEEQFDSLTANSIGKMAAK
ncbi:MAG: ABC transporter substrate-binding protein [Oscillospiraceae bacterium]|nr:ABC transporter substrate-binding protein [Oscillospiraceae bacterium]